MEKSLNYEKKTLKFCSESREALHTLDRLLCVNNFVHVLHAALLISQRGHGLNVFGHGKVMG